jgi:hypothetical protein
VAKLTDALEAYRFMKSKEEKSLIDMNLIEMLDPDIKEIFEIIYDEEKKVMKLDTLNSPTPRDLLGSPSTEENRFFGRTLLTRQPTSRKDLDAQTGEAL